MPEAEIAPEVEKPTKLMARKLTIHNRGHQNCSTIERATLAYDTSSAPATAELARGASNEKRKARIEVADDVG